MKNIRKGRALRRYLRRWVVERLFAWLHWFIARSSSIVSVS
jgi:hypothetical protein